MASSSSSSKGLTGMLKRGRLHIGRVLSMGNTAKTVPPTPSAPVEEPVPVRRASISGYFKIDIEGPFQYALLPKISRQISGYICSLALSAHPELKFALPFLYSALAREILEFTAYSSQDPAEFFNRINLYIPMKWVTSASTVPAMDSDINLDFSETWEIMGKAEYPYIIHCSGFMKVGSLQVSKRDEYRVRGFKDLPFPTAKEASKIKNIIALMDRGVSPKSSTNQGDMTPTVSETSVALPVFKLK